MKYCKCGACKECGCSRWWHHHESMTKAAGFIENKVRRFDLTRHVIEALWLSAKRRGSRPGQLQIGPGE